jgi:hypothetical protein
MGTIEDYSTGRISESIRKALRFFDNPAESSIDNAQAVRIQDRILTFRPMIMSISEASDFIRKASGIALGERVCRVLNPDSVSTESIFLDELAEAMILAGKARLVSLEDALLSLENNSGHPLVISNVSGRYLEICASYQPDCVYWRAEKHGLRCLKRKTV